MTTTRTPLVPDTITEDTPSCRRLGAHILGRALGHADELDGTRWDGSSVLLTAGNLGHTAADARHAARAYRDLLGA